MERIGRLPGSGTGDVVATVFCEQRLCGARVEGHCGRVAAGDGSAEWQSASLAKTQQDPTGCDGGDNREKRPEGHKPAVYRDLAGSEADVSRVDDDGAAESATVAAPAV